MIENYNKLCELINEANASGEKLSTLVMKQQALAMEISEAEVFDMMKKCYFVMENSVKEGIDKDLRSTSGLTGGDSYLLNEKLNTNNSLTGSLVAKSITYAVAVAEYNGAMGKIVAAPTAGSCGVIPAVIFAIKEEKGCSEEECIMSLFTASAIGMVIANSATLSGAEGGCQAEIGSASAMATAAAVELSGGTPNMVSNAVATALVNMMGLVCDPVAGLVEIPCIMRNAAGATNALTSAEIALAGVNFVIPADEVISTMKHVGNSMPSSLKETAEGGIAATPTGKKLFNQVFGDKADKAECVGCSKFKK